MNFKVFEYHHKDVPALKKDITFRAIFALLFFVVFVWQLTTLLIKVINNSVHLGIIISSTIVLVVCLLFAVISLLYALKELRIIGAIKTRGKCVSSVDILHNLNKDSFIKLYSIVTEILAIATSLVLICAITYSILEISFYASVSFYLPLLLTICLTGYFSMFHIKNEMNIVKTVEEFHNI